jgi:hypothetical protein
MSEDLTNKLPKTDSEKLNEILTRVNGIDFRLEQLEHTVAQRLHDTRPIWHKVVADIAQLQAGQERLENGQSHLAEQLLEINSRVRDVNRDQIVINDVMRRIQMDLHTVDERLYKIELSCRPQNSST